MTREILTKHMGFNVDVENIDFEYNNEILHGASFKIHL